MMNVIMSYSVSVDPHWASINLGIVICKNCAGVHRMFDYRVSKIRSLRMDTRVWTPSLTEVSEEEIFLCFAHSAFLLRKSFLPGWCQSVGVCYVCVCIFVFFFSCSFVFCFLTLNSLLFYIISFLFFMFCIVFSF